MMVSKCRTGLTVNMTALVMSLVLGASGVAAQTSTARLTGRVTGEDASPLVGATVTARSLATNAERRALTSETGFFTIPGLVPGAYEVRVEFIGRSPQTREVRAQIGQTLTVDFALASEAVELEGITVTAARPETEVRTPEVATNVTREQIESMPLNERNFLSLALLAPGVRRTPRGFVSGGQGADNLNVFIDGVSFKNDILAGGVAGQDASKGNPFPQVAVQEFRVITQNYKAEYQKAIGAVITAQTKSGTNEWEGGFFVNGQNNDLIEQDFFAVRDCEQGKAGDPDFECAAKPELDKWQFGGSLGGPIIRDRLFFFASYEGNHQTRAFNTQLESDTLTIGSTLLDSLRAHEGFTSSPFRSNLYFGKLTYIPNEAHRIEASVNIRDEYDIRSFGGRNSYDNAEHFFNDVNTFAVKHQYVESNWLNEATISYQQYHWNPIPLEDEVGINYEGVLKIGGRATRQDFTQRRLGLRNDISYTLANWLGEHVFKLGAYLDFVEYDVLRWLSEVPQFTFNSSNNWEFPIRASAGFGDPDLGANNRQFGAFIQDDWSISRQLTLNLGVRWDVETDMIDTDWVTPANVRQEVLDYAAALPCDGSDPKREQLCDPTPYFTDGSQRSPYYGAIQPRLGFSYDVFDDGRTTLFGGFGISYDRNHYGYGLSERATHQWATYTFLFSADGEPDGANPTIQWDDSYLSREGLEGILATGNAPKPELFLMKNELKPPSSRQFSLGVRQAAGPLLITANYTGSRGYDRFTWFRANRLEDGSCCAQFPSYSNVFVGDDGARSWYDAMYLKFEKPYTQQSPWGVQVSYTLSRADEEAIAEGRFSSLDVFTPDDFVRYPSRDDQRHHLTMNGIVRLPLDFRLSGIIDLGSATPYNATLGFGAGTNNCTHGNQDCLGGNDYPSGEARNWWRPGTHSFLGLDIWQFRNVDLRLERDFVMLQGQRIGVTAELFNVFNFSNFTGYDLRFGDIQEDGSITENEAFGKPTGILNNPALSGSSRRFQLGLKYEF